MAITCGSWKNIIIENNKQTLWFSFIVKEADGSFRIATAINMHKSAMYMTQQIEESFDTSEREKNINIKSNRFGRRDLCYSWNN